MKKNTALALLTTSTRARRSGFFVKKKNKIKKNKIDYDGLQRKRYIIYHYTCVCGNTVLCRHRGIPTPYHISISGDVTLEKKMKVFSPHSIQSHNGYVAFLYFVVVVLMMIFAIFSPLLCV